MCLENLLFHGEGNNDLVLGSLGHGGTYLLSVNVTKLQTVLLRFRVQGVPGTL